MSSTLFAGYIRIGLTRLVPSPDLPKNWPDITHTINPDNRYIAVLTGKINNIIVVDIDTKNGQTGSLKWFESHFGDIRNTNTLVTTTKSDGYHVYFKYTPKLYEKKNIKKQNLGIDILSNKACCFEGQGYGILTDCKVRELSPQELNSIVDLAYTPVTSVVDLIRVNKTLKMPQQTTWNITKIHNGYRIGHDSYVCTLCKDADGSHLKHSDPNHSCIFYDSGNKVMTNTCFSGGSEVMDKKTVQTLCKYFRIVIDTQENNAFQILQKDLVQRASVAKYKRDTFGNVYRQVRTYAYELMYTPREFLNDIFIDDSTFKSNVNNMDNLVKFMRQYDDRDFPFIKPSKDYIGFSNGILNMESLEFTRDSNIIDPNIVVRKYIPQDFVYATDTPILDKILDYQFTPDVRDFIYACLGRILYPKDNLGFMTYLLGEPGCGKSVILKTICACFEQNDIGVINDSFERKYGISYLHAKDLVICDDVPRDIASVFPQQTFQSIITCEKVSSAVKNGDAITVDWKAPLLFAGNWHMNYIDKGQMSRRVLTVNFEKNVYSPDPSLKDKILASELPAFVYKSLRLYSKLILTHSTDKGIWDIVPKYFIELQREFKMERNPLYKFLVESCEYSIDSYLQIEQIRIVFSNSIGKTVKRLDNGTFGQVDREYVIDTMNICKWCDKEACGGKTPCCLRYRNTDRSKKKVVRNVRFRVQ